MLASTVMRDAQRAGLPVRSITPLGSLRRFAPAVGDVSLLAVAPAAAHHDVLTGFARLTAAVILARSATHLIIGNDRGTVSVHVAVPEEAGAALVWHTGSRTHTSALQTRAQRLGLTFDRARLLDRQGQPLSSDTEADFYRHLELPEIPPELREDGDEIIVAERGELPPLVSTGDIRGDLHMHSTWSDGRDSIEQMAFASQQLGYEYIAITDHSERAPASRQLAASDIRRQGADIQRAGARVKRVQILHGVEVDIMHDGSLDFDDEQLAGFDIVLASLHDHAGHDASKLTERYLRAIRHPLVNVITHPANRTPGRSSGYPLDFDALFAAAAETGTAMEVDGAPGHLDLDGALARRAVAAGVTLVIDSDCHRSDGLGRQMRFGVGTARRGWIGPEHVLNTRGLDEVRAFVARKRARG
ncbi:MAG TPA: DNA polymerase/3'-5' exonuclease PolX [Vicinamibacterales bacterium]|nr:DNA polymerase/3'-5' exonuclease PolX [Vicinamibacterales bacterium]